MAKQSITRRGFIKTAGLAVAAGSAAQFDAAGSSVLPSAAPAATAYKYPNPGKIVVVYHPNAVLGYNNVDFNVVQGMFDQGIMQFTGITSSPAAALASLFPGLTTSKKIAIKPSLLGSSVPTRKELVKAVITRLVQMLGGFPAANITLYERHSFSALGYTTTYFGQSVKLVIDTSFPNLGYTIYCNGKNRPYSKSLYEADYLINMPVIKDHSCAADFNVTLAFKNHMGTVNPGGSLGIHCDKVACLDIMASSVMTAKQRLVIMDGLFAIYNGGPDAAPQATPKRIYISQDPVTIDYQGRKVINELRVQNGLSPKAAGYIEQAAAAPYEIGVADPAQMNVVTVNLPVEMKSFDGRLARDEVLLAWTTAAESNNAGFAVERSETGSGGWETCGFVKGSGTGPGRAYAFTDRIPSRLRALASLWYRLRQVDFDGAAVISGTIEVRLLPEEGGWILEQNYPNPFSRGTDIPVRLPAGTKLRIEVIDPNGKLVETVKEGWIEAGSHSIHWNAARHAAGVYTCRARAEGFTKEIKMVLVK